MSEKLTLPTRGTKEELYRAVVPQIASIIADSKDLIANLANVSAILKQAFNFHWVGFYRTTEPALLTLGPFQGPLACVSIAFSRGVCGAAARTQQAIVVPDVEAFPGHIACSSLSKSEIVIPLVQDGATRLVLDVDSDKLNDFDEVDEGYLHQIVELLRVQHFLKIATAA